MLLLLKIVKKKFVFFVKLFSTNLPNLDQIAEEIEKDLYLLGCSAVEDRLQDNVPKVIQDLLLAGIKVWMLTGDKLETAENIAHSCRLITGEMHVMRCFGKTSEEVFSKLRSNKEEFTLCMNEKRKKAFIVEGEALGKKNKIIYLTSTS